MEVNDRGSRVPKGHRSNLPKERNGRPPQRQAPAGRTRHAAPPVNHGHQQGHTASKQSRPHERTGELPRVQGVHYLDSTGSLPQTGPSHQSRGRVRVDSRERVTRDKKQQERQRRRTRSHVRAFSPLALLLGGVVLVALIVVLVAWGCTRQAAQKRADEEAAQQESQEQAPQNEQPAADLDGVEPGTYYVVLVNETNASLCLSASGTEDDDYTVMQLGATGYNASLERLTLTIVDGSSCTLATEGGLYVDAGDASAGPGLRLYANQPNDGDGQKWEIEHATGGFRIKSKETGWVIEAPDASRGTELITNTEDGSNTNQVFRFVPVEETTTPSGASARG